MTDTICDICGGKVLGTNRMRVRDFRPGSRAQKRDVCTRCSVGLRQAISAIASEARKRQAQTRRREARRRAEGETARRTAAALAGLD